jgi:hypothetical protein
VTESDTGATRTVEVRDDYLVSDPAHPKRFMRLQVTRYLPSGISSPQQRSHFILMLSNLTAYMLCILAASSVTAAEPNLVATPASPFWRSSRKRMS